MFVHLLSKFLTSRAQWAPLEACGSRGQALQSIIKFESVELVASKWLRSPPFQRVRNKYTECANNGFFVSTNSSATLFIAWSLEPGGLRTALTTLCSINCQKNQRPAQGLILKRLESSENDLSRLFPLLLLEVVTVLRVRTSRAAAHPDPSRRQTCPVRPA
jgi:hypothetical protein